MSSILSDIAAVTRIYAKLVIFNLQRQITWREDEEENEVPDLSRSKVVLVFVLGSKDL